MLQLTYNDRLRYPSYTDADDQMTAVCWARIYEPPLANGVPVVIVTELPENHSTSVTNAFERLASLVWGRFLDRYKEGFIWVEHYPDRYPTPMHRAYRLARIEERQRTGQSVVWQPNDERFALVEYRILDKTRQHPLRFRHPLMLLVEKPLWLPMTQPSVEAVIGQPLAGIPANVLGQQVGA